MQKIAQIVTAFSALILFAGVGLRWLLAPESAGAEFGITLDGPVAFNQVRGDMGGAFVALGGLCAYALYRREARWLQAVAIATFGVAVGRTVGLVADGFAPESFAPIVVEVVMGSMMLVAARGFEAAPER